MADKPGPSGRAVPAKTKIPNLSKPGSELTMQSGGKDLLHSKVTVGQTTEGARAVKRTRVRQTPIQAIVAQPSHRTELLEHLIREGELLEEATREILEKFSLFACEGENTADENLTQEEKDLSQKLAKERAEGAGEAFEMIREAIKGQERALTMLSELVKNEKLQTEKELPEP